MLREGTVTCRQVLNLMVITGFMLLHMLNLIFPFAMTAMVGDGTNATNRGTEKEAYEVELFQWNKHEQNLLLGIFFLGYIITEIMGGRFSEIHGTKKILGGGILGASVLTIATPTICSLGFVPVAVLRFTIGLSVGASFPSIPPMVAKWIPPLNRSKFMSNLLATALGLVFTLTSCGLIIDRFGWAASFYFTGTIGVVWSFAWFHLVYDSPAVHPRIAAAERLEIETKIAEVSKGSAPKSVPWSKMMRSGPVWAVIITIPCATFGYLTLITQLPAYMKEVLHYDIKTSGLLSSVPYLVRYMSGVLSSHLCDKMLASRRYSTTTLRKAFTTCGLLIPAMFMSLQATFGEERGHSVAILTCAMFFNGAHVAGDEVNSLDISPNFAGTIYSVAATFATLGAYVSTVVVAALVNEGDSFTQWANVFWILAGVYMFGCLIFLIFASGEVQPWNSVEDELGINGDNHPLENDNVVTEV